MSQDIQKEHVEAARKFFAGEAGFIFGSMEPGNFPNTTLPEVAIIGYSNVGKSSLINALTNRKNLARTSSRPGATRQINFFTIRNQCVLADLPGYGYAKVSKKEQALWRDIIESYLSERQGLRRVFLLIDARRGLRPLDQNFMQQLDSIGVSYQIVITKSDKAKKEELNQYDSQEWLDPSNHPALLNNSIITSSNKRKGIETLQTTIHQLSLSTH